MEAIASANQPRVSSVDIQAIFLDFAKGLGFESEKMLTSISVYVQTIS